MSLNRGDQVFSKELPNHYKDNLYAQAYGPEYIPQIEKLEHLLLNHITGANKFIVVPIEAALEKSRQTSRILGEYYRDSSVGPRRRFLVVKPFKDDVRQTQDSINLINSNGQMALGITADNWKDWRTKQDEIRNFPIVVITHERYIDLALDCKTREKFGADRDVLVIDEGIEFPTFAFSLGTYNELHRLLCASPLLESALVDICKNLRLTINLLNDVKGKNNLIIRCRPEIDVASVQKFAAIIEANKSNIIGDKKQREVLNQFLEGLPHLYNHTCLYNNGTIRGYNRGHHLWGLQNNIILDAGGNFNSIYEREYIQVAKFDRIIDYSNSSIQWIKINTSKSKVNKSFETLSSLISEKARDGLRNLVIVHKIHEQAMANELRKLGITVATSEEIFTNQQVALDHFGNLVGRNTYREFDRCWIVATPNIPLDAHIIHDCQYSGKEPQHDRYQMGGNKYTYVLLDHELDKIRQSKVETDTYQAIKRIQRNPWPIAEIFVATKDEKLFDSLCGKFLNINICEPIEMETGANSEKNVSRSEDIQADALRQYFMNPETKLGAYPKKDMQSLVGCTKNFNRVLKNVRIRELEEAGIIRVDHHKITKLKDTKSYA